MHFFQRREQPALIFISPPALLAADIFFLRCTICAESTQHPIIIIWRAGAGCYFIITSRAGVKLKFCASHQRWWARTFAISACKFVHSTHGWRRILLCFAHIKYNAIVSVYNTPIYMVLQIMKEISITTELMARSGCTHAACASARRNYCYFCAAARAITSTYQHQARTLSGARGGTNFPF